MKEAESPHKDSHLIFVQERGAEESEPSPDPKPSSYCNAKADIILASRRTKATTGAGLRDVNMSSEAKQFRSFGGEIVGFFTFFHLAIRTSVAMAVVGLIAVLYNTSNCTAFSNDAHGMNVVFARTTIGGIESDSDNNRRAFLVNQFLMICVLVFGFNLAFHWKGLDKQINKTDPQLTSHQFGVVIRKPQDVTTDEVGEYLRQFGRVVEVVQFRKLGDTVYYAKELHQLRDLIRFQGSIQQGNPNSHTNIQELQKQRRKVQKQLDEVVTTVNESLKEGVLCIGVFERESDCQKCIEVLQQYRGCCKGDGPEQLQLAEKVVEAEALTSQPEEVIWQNQHVTTPILPAILLLVLINVLAFTVIGVLAVLSAAHQHVYYYPELPSNTLSLASIKGESNTTLVASWCLGNTPTTDSQSLCGEYLSLQNSQMWTYFWVAVAIIFANVMMKYFFHWYSGFFRFSFRSHQRGFIFQQVFIHYMVVTVALALSIQTNIFGQATVTMLLPITSGKAKANLQSLQQYYDYQPQWYLDYGYQLILDYLLLAFLPHIIRPFFSHLLSRLKHQRARIQPTQQAMERALELQEFEVADHYAAMFMMLCLGLLFAGAMPVMLLFMPIAIYVRYLMAKYLFLYCYKVPLPSNMLSQSTTTVLIICLTLYVFNGVWAYGVQAIFPLNHIIFPSVAGRNQNAHNPIEALLVFGNRLMNSWLLVLFYFGGLLLILFRERVVGVYQQIRGERNDRPEIEMQQAPVMGEDLSNPSEQGQVPLPRSYQMHNCLQYQAVWQQLRDRNVI